MGEDAIDIAGLVDGDRVQTLLDDVEAEERGGSTQILHLEVGVELSEDFMAGGFRRCKDEYVVDIYCQKCMKRRRKVHGWICFERIESDFDDGVAKKKVLDLWCLLQAIEGLVERKDFVKEML